MEATLRRGFGERIRQLRKSLGLTQEELAEKADMDYKYLGAVERGERNITIDNIEKIAKGFQVEACQLFLFSIQGLNPEEALTEDKLRDIIERCSSEKKQVMLKIVGEIASYEEK